MPRNYSTVKKRSVRIAGHETSITLEQEFWNILCSIADERGTSLNKLITEIDAQRTSNLSSALRVFILQHLQAKLAE